MTAPTYRQVPLVQKKSSSTGINHRRNGEQLLVGLHELCELKLTQSLKFMNMKSKKVQIRLGAALLRNKPIYVRIEQSVI